MKLLKSAAVVVLIFVLSAISIVLSPIFFLVWGILNRKHISLWLSIPLMLMSTIVYLMLFTFFKEFSPNIDLIHNPSIYYGICLIAPFLLTRLSSLRAPLATKQKYLISIVLFVLALLFSLTLVVLIHYLSYKRQLPNYLFITETIILLWVSLSIYLFMRYPEDALIENIKRYGSLLFRWIHEAKDDQ